MYYERYKFSQKSSGFLFVAITSKCKKIQMKFCLRITNLRTIFTQIHVKSLFRKHDDASTKAQKVFKVGSIVDLLLHTTIFFSISSSDRSLPP